MLIHILGYGTLLAQAVGAAGLGAYLTKVGRRPYSWMKPPKAPKFATDFVIRGDDWTGLI